MATLSFNCSVEQGFNFQKDAQTLVGYINSLKIGTKEFKKDITVTNPEDLAGDKVKVVGIVSNIYWNGGFSEPIEFSCQISAVNKQDAIVLQHTSLSDTAVEFSYTIYDYDPIAKKFFKCFHTDAAALKGLVMKNGGDLAINVDPAQSMQVPSPINFSFYMGIMPQETEQDTKVAVSLSGKFVKKWGVAVSA